METERNLRPETLSELALQVSDPTSRTVNGQTPGGAAYCFTGKKEKYEGHMWDGAKLNLRQNADWVGRKGFYRKIGGTAF